MLKKEALDYFQSLLCSNDPKPPYLHSSHMSRLSDGGCDCLSAPVLQKEVKRALNSIKPLKAPGPDGFYAIFFKNTGM